VLVVLLSKGCALVGPQVCAAGDASGSGARQRQRCLEHQLCWRTRVLYFGWVQVLSESDCLVTTFSSNMGRLAYAHDPPQNFCIPWSIPLSHNRSASIISRTSLSSSQSKLQSSSQSNTWSQIRDDAWKAWREGARGNNDNTNEEQRQ
jgi:hypothetical protein